MGERKVKQSFALIIHAWKLDFGEKIVGYLWGKGCWAGLCDLNKFNFI